MKKCFKPIALVITLCITMIMFASCGNKAEQISFTDAIKKAAEITEGTETIETTFNIKVDNLADDVPQEAADVINQLGIDINNIVVGLKADAKFNSTSKQSVVDIYYKLGVNDYKKLTDIIAADDAVYINIKSIIKEAMEIASLFSTQQGGMANNNIDDYIKEDYLKYDAETIKSMMDDYVISSTPSESVIDNAQIYLKDIADIILPSLQTAIDNLGSTVITEQDGLQTLTINNANLASILTECANAVTDNISEIIDKLVEMNNSIGTEESKNTANMLAQQKEIIVANVSTYKDKIQEGINELVKEINDEGATFNISVGTGFKDDTFTLKGIASISQTNGGGSVSYTITKKAETISGITAPSSYVTIDEFYQNMAM